MLFHNYIQILEKLSDGGFLLTFITAKPFIRIVINHISIALVYHS